MARKFISREETMRRRIQTILENRQDISYWSNLFEHQENLIFIVRQQLGIATRSQNISDDFIIQQVGVWLQFNTDVSSISSLGNIADDDSDNNSTMDKSKSFNAPLYERLPESPPTPVIHRPRHQALQAPAEASEQETEYPSSDASSNGSRTELEETIYAPQAAQTIFVPPAEAMGHFPPELESTRVEFTMLFVPVPNLYGEANVPMTLTEQADFNDVADQQLDDNGSQELQNNNGYIQLNEE